MRLAYYEEHDYHTEIMGLFLDYCLKNNYTCDYYNNKDQSYFLEHYEHIFNINPLNRFKNEELRNKIDVYDYIIIGTMGHSNLIDDLILAKPDKFLQVYHNDDDLKKVDKNLNSYATKKIVLTPLNDKVAPYLLPIFSVSKPPTKRDRIVTIVGRFTNHRSYESLLPLLNFDYTIWVISRRPKFVPEPLVELSRKNPNLKISYKLDAQKMSQVLMKSRFILCVAENDSWYYKDRLTGTIPLSYNYDLPVLIPSKLNQIYGLAGAVEYEEPEGIPDLIKAIDLESGRYESLVETLIKQKAEIIEGNRKQLELLTQSS